MSDPVLRDPTTAKFLRGLTIGALLGAIVAGSSIWSRWIAARRSGSEPPSGRPER